MTRRYHLLCGLLALVVSTSPGTVMAAAADDTAVAPGAGFALQDKPGEYLDVLLDGKVVARYMYAYDKSTPAPDRDLQALPARL